MTPRDWFGLVVRTVGLLYALALLSGVFVIGLAISGTFWGVFWWGLKLALSLFLLFRADVLVHHVYKNDHQPVQ